VGFLALDFGLLAWGTGVAVMKKVVHKTLFELRSRSSEVGIIGKSAQEVVLGSGRPTWQLSKKWSIKPFDLEVSSCAAPHRSQLVEKGAIKTFDPEVFWFADASVVAISGRGDPKNADG